MELMSVLLYFYLFLRYVVVYLIVVWCGCSVLSPVLTEICFDNMRLEVATPCSSFDKRLFIEFAAFITNMPVQRNLNPKLAKFLNIQNFIFYIAIVERSTGFTRSAGASKQQCSYM